MWIHAALIGIVPVGAIEGAALLLVHLRLRAHLPLVLLPDGVHVGAGSGVGPGVHVLEGLLAAHASVLLDDLVLGRVLPRRRHSWDMLRRHTHIAELPVVNSVELLLICEAQTLEGGSVVVLEALVVAASIRRSRAHAQIILVRVLGRLLLLRVGPVERLLVLLNSLVRHVAERFIVFVPLDVLAFVLHRLELAVV